jgi:HD-like signal output (HDOD) protein
MNANAENWHESLRVLPTLPAVLFRLLGLTGDSEVDERQLADFLWKDPALLTRVLPMAIAASGGRMNLRQATARLGRARIQRVAQTTPLLRSFDPLGAGSSAAILWERSILCAHACEAAARYLEFRDSDRYYVAGLLHDLGYIALLHRQPKLLARNLQRWEATPADLLEVEAETFGMNHCQLGLKLAAQLGLPVWVFPAIGSHHNPTRDSDPVARVTCIGSAFCNYQRVDWLLNRQVLPATQRAGMEEIISGLLPGLDREKQFRLIDEMEKAVRPVRKKMREMLLGFGPMVGLPQIQPPPLRYLREEAVSPMAYPA